MKNIVLIAPPFSGHLHPILGIAKELQIKGFNVSVISTKSVEDKILSIGVKFYSILDKYEETIFEIANPNEFIKSNPVKMIRQLKQNICILKYAKNELEEILMLINPDYVIADFTITVVGLICEKLKIKWMTTLPSPCVYENQNGVPAYLGGLKPSNNILIKGKYYLYNKFIRLMKKTFFSIFSKELKEIGFNSLYRKDGSEIIYSNQKIFALGLKELEFNKHQYDFFQYVGPVLYTPNIKEVNPTMFSFSKEKKNILVTFGTHLKFFKKDVIEYFKDFVRQNNKYNIHISLGDDSVFFINKIDENLIVYSFVPYEQYLKNYDIVIHHGGSGIMYECIKHGKPSIVFPQDYDQFDNAARMEYANIGIRIKKFKDVNNALRQLEINNKYQDYINKYQKILIENNPIGYVISEINNFYGVDQ